MSKIKLLVDAHVFDAEYQGSRTYIENIYKHLIAKYSNNIEFFFVAHNTALLESVFGTTVNYLQLKSSNKFSRLLFEFTQLIKENNIDWAHFQYISPIFKSCKYIITCHDVLFERYPKFFPFSYRFTKHFLFKRSAKQADLLTTVSDFSKVEISKYYNIDKSNIHVTYNGVRFEKESQNPKNTKPYILFISRIEPRKNHHLLLKAMIELGLFDKGYKMVIVGKQSIANHEFNRLKNEVLKRQPESIVLFENISEKEKNGLIDACKLFVYPSSAEGFGIPPLEAALRKVPVICSNKTSMKEFDFFGKGHINPENMDELKNTISGFIDGSIKTDLDEIASKIEKRYNWENSADVLSELILNYK